MDTCWRSRIVWVLAVGTTDGGSTIAPLTAKLTLSRPPKCALPERHYVRTGKRFPEELVGVVQAGHWPEVQGRTICISSVARLSRGRQVTSSQDWMSRRGRKRTMPFA